MTDYAEHLNALSGLMADHYGYRTPVPGPQDTYTTADITARMSAPTGASGGWDNDPKSQEPSRDAWIARARAVDDYIKSLPGRAMVSVPKASA